MITIARMTLREALRKKLLIAALILAVLYLVLFGTGLYFASRDIGHVRAGVNVQFMKSMAYAQLTTMGLYLASFIMAFLAIFSAIGAVSTEIENGLLHAIVPRPIRRIEIILGKFLGHSLVIAIFGLFIFSTIVILIEAMLGFGMNNTPQALLLFILQPILLLAVTMLGTAFLPTLGNGVVAFLLYSLAVIGGFTEQIGAIFNSQAAVNVGIITSLVMPSDAIYRKMISLVLPPSTNLFPQALGPFGSMSTPSVWMVVYAVGHLIIVLALAIYVFNQRDI
jgi:ABC-type transport system involved in multi-copper enzyme maturation permease subunit